jgi:hypothetical protein
MLPKIRTFNCVRWVQANCVKPRLPHSRQSVAGQSNDWLFLFKIRIVLVLEMKRNSKILRTVNTASEFILGNKTATNRI